MDTTEMGSRARRARWHAERLAQRSLRVAGSRTDVGRALGKRASTIAHEVTDRANPELRKALEVGILLNGHPGTNARGVAEAMLEAVELSEIIAAESETLVHRGAFLIDAMKRHVVDVWRATMFGGPKFSEALRGLGSTANELATILDELATPERQSIDLLELCRRRVVS